MVTPIEQFRNFAVPMSKIVYIVTIIFISFSSCKKREKNIQASQDYAHFQNDLSAIIPLAIHLAQSKSYLNHILISQKDSLSTCASINYTSGDTSQISNAPIQFNLRYENCIDTDGFTKNGVINCTLSNYLSINGGSCVITLNSFRINDRVLSGSILITHTSGYDFKIATTHFVTKVGKRSYSYDGFLDYTITNGNNMALLTDNSVTVSDNGEFYDRFGKSYIVDNQGITRYLNCGYYSSGIVEIVNEDNTTQVLDFGVGQCSSQANVTFAEDVFTISLD